MPTSRTHLAIDPELCGDVVSLADGEATVRLTMAPRMAVDDRGLVHGGFVFGQVDYAAMLAINEPTVVLGAADVRFKAPVRVGDEVLATARCTQRGDKKSVVAVSACVGDRVVLEGTLTVFVLPKHVLDS